MSKIWMKGRQPDLMVEEKGIVLRMMREIRRDFGTGGEPEARTSAKY